MNMVKIKLLFLSLILLIANIPAEAAYTKSELRDILSEIFNNPSHTFPLEIQDNIYISGFHYDIAANTLTMKYLITEESIFNIYLNTRHGALQSSTITNMAYFINSMDKDIRYVMTDAFEKVNPHVICAMSNGMGTTVKTEFDGIQLAEYLNDANPTQAAMDNLKTQLDVLRSALPVKVDAITYMTKITLNDTHKYLDLQYEIDNSSGAFTSIANSPKMMRLQLRNALIQYPFAKLVADLGYDLRYSYYCQGNPSVKPAVFTFTAKEIQELCN